MATITTKCRLFGEILPQPRVIVNNENVFVIVLNMQNNPHNWLLFIINRRRPRFALYCHSRPALITVRAELLLPFMIGLSKHPFALTTSHELLFSTSGLLKQATSAGGGHEGRVSRFITVHAEPFTDRSCSACRSIL